MSLLLAITDKTIRFYLVLIVPSIVYIVLIYFLFPETKGKAPSLDHHPSIANISSRANAGRDRRPVRR